MWSRLLPQTEDVVSGGVCGFGLGLPQHTFLFLDVSSDCCADDTPEDEGRAGESDADHQRSTHSRILIRDAERSYREVCWEMNTAVQNSHGIDRDHDCGVKKRCDEIQPTNVSVVEITEEERRRNRVWPAGEC